MGCRVIWLESIRSDVPIEKANRNAEGLRQRLQPFEKFARLVESHWDGIASCCQTALGPRTINLNKFTLGEELSSNSILRETRPVLSGAWPYRHRSL